MNTDFLRYLYSSSLGCFRIFGVLFQKLAKSSLPIYNNGMSVFWFKGCFEEFVNLLSACNSTMPFNPYKENVDPFIFKLIEVLFNLPNVGVSLVLRFAYLRVRSADLESEIITIFAIFFPLYVPLKLHIFQLYIYIELCWSPLELLLESCNEFLYCVGCCEVSVNINVSYIIRFNFLHDTSLISIHKQAS